MSSYNYAFMGISEAVWMSGHQCNQQSRMLCFALLIALSFFLLLYGMPAPSAEHQHPEAWPASTYKLLREVWVTGVLNDNCPLGRMGQWVHVTLSSQALGRRATRSSGMRTQHLGLEEEKDVEKKKDCTRFYSMYGGKEPSDRLDSGQLDTQYTLYRIANTNQKKWRWLFSVPTQTTI